MKKPVCTVLDQAQEVANKAIKASHDLQRATRQFHKGWDASWVHQLNATLRADKARHDSERKAFVLTVVLPVALQTWWAKTDGGESVIRDTETRFMCHQIKIPSATLSDEMVVARRSELKFGSLLHKNGLGSLQSMGNIASAVSCLADDYFYHSKRENTACQSVEEFVKKALPVILAYTRYMGAKTVS